MAKHPTDASSFLDEWVGESTPWFDQLRRGQALHPAESILGFEVAGAEETLDLHSWHCHGYADDLREALGIKVNEVCPLPSLDEASAVLEWMLQLPPEQAPEPVPWTVIALAST